MVVSKTFKVYGENGYDQKMSHNKSVYWDWSDDIDNTRIFEVFNSDLTGTNEYSLVHITRNTEEECDKEISGQITDGYFENARVGKVEEVDNKIVEDIKNVLKSGWELDKGKNGEIVYTHDALEKEFEYDIDL